MAQYQDVTVGVSEMSDVKLPRILQKLKEARDAKKEWEAEEKAINERAIAFLEKAGNSIEGANLITTTKIKINNEKAMDWAKANFTPKEFESCLVKAFDENQFYILLRRKLKALPKEKRKSLRLPKGIVTTITGKQIRFARS